MAAHSNVVGGSTAKRVMACPGSVALVQQMPPQPSSVHADTGTLLHNTIASILETGKPPHEFLGATYNAIELTEDLLERKMLPALAALDEIDPDKTLEYAVEQVVGFGNALPGVFGSADLVGRIGNRGVLLDWKFGDGVAVDAKENPQALFYCAAALRTTKTKWAFLDVEDIEIIIVQPPYVKRWVTTPARVKQFEAELMLAERAAEQPDAPLAAGDHCRWCTAKTICPVVSGAVARAARTAIKTVNVDRLAEALGQIDLLEGYIKDARDMAQHVCDPGRQPIAGGQVFEHRMRHAGTDAHATVGQHVDRTQPVDAMDFDQQRRPDQPQVEHRAQALATGDHAHLVVGTGGSQRGDGLVQRRGPVVAERGRLHGGGIQVNAGSAGWSPAPSRTRAACRAVPTSRAVTGARVTETPSPRNASVTALPMAAGPPMQPPSPVPFMPSSTTAYEPAMP